MVTLQEPADNAAHAGDPFLAREKSAVEPRIWASIHDPLVSLVLAPQPAPVGAWTERLLLLAPFVWRFEGPATGICTQFPDAPAELLAHVSATALCFSEAVGCDQLRVRVEGVTGNACTKVHADYVDVRLIQTLAGPGTEYVPAAGRGAPLARVPTGWIGLFKGLLYPAHGTPGHAPCLHRSPAIDGSGAVRLVLVIEPAGGDASCGGGD